VAIIILLVKIIPVNNEIKRTEQLLFENHQELKSLDINSTYVDEVNDAKKDTYLFNQHHNESPVQSNGPRITRKQQNNRRRS
jgi:hypothetical protein